MLESLKGKSSSNLDPTMGHCHEALLSFAPKQLEAQKTFNSFGGGKPAGVKIIQHF